MFAKTTTYFALLAALAVGSTSCNDDDDTTAAPDPNMVELTATINAAQQVPAVTSSATGTMNATYNKVSNELKYTVTYQGMTPTMGHFHKGAPGQTGDPIVTLQNVTTSPITGTATLSEADEALLLNKGLYVNLHSATYRTGEIRGNISVK